MLTKSTTELMNADAGLLFELEILTSKVFEAPSKSIQA